MSRGDLTGPAPGRGVADRLSRRRQVPSTPVEVASRSEKAPV